MKLIRLPQTLDLQGISKSVLYANIQQGLMTPPVKIGNSSAWPEQEVLAINAALIAGKSKDKIKELVKKLIANRQNAETAA